MFSMTPRIGTATLRNMVTPRRASMRARSCGVETMTAPGERRRLRHGELGVAGAGRHVDDEDVELAPGDLAQHLGDRRLHHRPAPDHRRLGLDQEADRHHLDAVAVHRGEQPLLDDARLARQPEQLRHRGAVDVGVEQADLQALCGQREGEVAGGGGLADAALAGGDGDDVADTRECRARARRSGTAGRPRAAARARLRRRAGWFGPRSEVRLAKTPETPGIARIVPSAWRRIGSKRSASLGSIRIENITRLVGSTTTCDRRPEAGSVVPAGIDGHGRRAPSARRHG